MLEIKVTIDATPGLLSALSALTGGVTNSAPVKQMASTNGAAKPVKTEHTATNESDETISLESIRAAMAAKKDAGKSKQIIALLAEYGVKNLTALPKEQYAEFKPKMEAL